ncbi:MAG: c-type cytochrome [Planctomycetales bacterium]|nr:c-type cytochrome [Planctomycetales bacterium]
MSEKKFLMHSVAISVFSVLVCYFCWLGSEAAVVRGAEAEPSAERSRPLEPAAALESLVTAPGVRVELVASEPEVIDPVSIRFDEDGRLWVVEMRDYPLGPQPGEPPASRIKVLEDRDGDGRFETAHVFADELEFPTGLQPWRGGVFVTFSGKVAYLTDKDGDLRADGEEIWLTGFAEMNTQLRANHPTLGLDRNIYIANGLRGGTVTSAFEVDREPIDIRSNDLRFDPVTRKFEPIAGVSQYGMTLDDFGNRFLCNNRFPLMHVVIEDHYARRNPNYALPALVETVALAGEDSRVYPICRSWTTSLQHAGQFTAACGVTIYRGDGLPAEMYGNSFTCDPTGSLVHREILQRAGATFRSHAAREGVEFLASRDEWFRPVDLSVGPDGALYVVDMYRAVIEHPQFMPAELQQRPDLRNGDDRGRIYRLVATGFQRQSPLPRLSNATDSELVELLARENAWTRETAGRLLLEKQELAVVNELEHLAREAELPATRAAALHVLAGHDLLARDVVQDALADTHPAVRQQAVVVAERWLGDADSLRPDVLSLSNDTDPRVRFQVTLSLAPMRGQNEIDYLKSIALAGAEDPWSRRAVAISMAGAEGDLLRAILADESWYTDGVSAEEKLLLVEFVEQFGKSAPEVEQLALARQLATMSPGIHVERLQQIALAALCRKGRISRSLTDFAGDSATAMALQRIFEATQELANSAHAEATRRTEAIALLGYDGSSAPLLAELALSESTPAVQLAAVDALSYHHHIEPWQALLSEFSALMPLVRNRVLEAVVRNSDRSALLLDAVESGAILPGDIGRVAADQLRRHPNESIRERSNRILPAAVPADREAVLADYQAALELPADPVRGREVFRKQCTTCHSVAGIGVQVGPNVGDNYAKTQEQLLADILQPNRAIDNNYIGYLVVTDEGRTFSGLLISESATSLSLLQEESKQVTFSKSEIESINSTGLSLMPVGLEKNIPHQDMADLLSFLKNWRYLDGLTPYSDQSKEN